MMRGTRLDLRHSRKVRYYLSGRHGDELNNGAMAQLVARFHGMEEVGGSNPPSSTENIDIRFRVSIFLLHEQGWHLWLQLGQLIDRKYNVSVSACGMFKICQTEKALKIGRFTYKDLLKKS